MYAFAEPVTPEQIEKVQGMNQKAVEEFENEMMGITRDEEARFCGDDLGEGVDE